MNKGLQEFDMILLRHRRSLSALFVISTLAVDLVAEGSVKSTDGVKTQDAQKSGSHRDFHVVYDNEHGRIVSVKYSSSGGR